MYYTLLLKRKLIYLGLFSLWFSHLAIAQGILGQWNGVLKVQGFQLRIVFHITKTDSGYAATMDSPDQKANGIPVNTCSFENQVLKLQIKNIGIEYEGMLEKEGLITGTFKQLGQAFPMNLSKEMQEKETVFHPQEPQKPYPYYSEEITFENKKAAITLSGTLTLPQREGNFPLVILISGSGPQNRDEELLGHKPFLVLSDYLTRNGIAVLRFDDRGTADSKGDFKSATTSDFSEDVEAALHYSLSRKEINKQKIGLIGHSEGGMIAPMVAIRNKTIHFIVLLAGTGIPGNELLLLQEALIYKASGKNDSTILTVKEINSGAFDLVIHAKNTDQLKTDLNNYLSHSLDKNPGFLRSLGISKEDYIQRMTSSLSSPWMQYFIRYDPAKTMEKVTCPVLALNGSKDLQVPPKENLSAIKKALEKGGNKHFISEELPNLNHLFQECKTGNPSEYAQIEQTFSPAALELIGNWIQQQVKK